MVDFLLSSPLEARQSATYLIPIIIGILAISIILGIGLLFLLNKKRQEKMKSDPNRKTNKADIEYVAKRMKLTREEADFLFYLCKKNDIKNLSLQIQDINNIYNIFKIEHDKNFENYDEMMKDAFFKLMTKIDYQYNLERIITSTTQIEEQTPVTFLYNGKTYESRVFSQSPEGILFEIPLSLDGEEIDIKSMQKLIMKFSSKSSSIGYKVEVRFLRYAISGNDKKFLIAHVKNISTIHRRKEKRIPFTEDCEFRAAQIKSSKNKAEKKEFSISDKVHKGRFANISNGGCSIITNLPIKNKQLIYVEFKFRDEQSGKLIGMIVNNEFKKQENLYDLHIKTIKIDTNTKNNIRNMYF